MELRGDVQNDADNVNERLDRVIETRLRPPPRRDFKSAS